MFAALDKFGRIVIPKKLREDLGITTGTRLKIEEDGKRIIIEPVREEEPLVEVDGILVFTGEIHANIDQHLSEDRNQRLKKLLTEG